MNLRNIVISLLLFNGFSVANAAQSQQFTLQNAFPNLSFNKMVDLQHPGDGTNRIFVASQSGFIYVFENTSSVNSTKIFLDIQNKVAVGGELGLLGFAFHPDYEHNGYFYVHYTAPNPLRSVIARYSVSATNPDAADNTSEQILFQADQPAVEHKGGQIAFGPDGYLYSALGDGISGGDPLNNGQNKASSLGKILRIDVNCTSQNKNYCIPPDNPFAGNTQGYKEEIYAYGFRNPWRFSFDPPTGWLWAADVGQDLLEEIDIVNKGENYGWRIMEGNHCFNPSSGCDTTGISLPVWEYTHDGGDCSITGGYVYRGAQFPELYGKYIYGDFCTGNIWALHYDGVSQATNTLLVTGNINITSFGIDKDNEIYICALNAKIYKLSPILVSHWKFDEGSGTTAADSSVNGNNGNIIGATWATGKSGSGLSFDGNDYVIRTNPSAGLKPSLEVATAAWIKMSATDTGGAEIVSMGDSYAIRVQTNGNIQFFYYNGTTWKSIITTGVNVRDGVWHHIVGQKTSAALQIYVDGISKASISNTGTITYTLGTGLFIGRHGNGDTIYDFTGIIDDVRIYNRALSNQEVLELYNLYVQSPTPTPVTTPTPGLIPDLQARYALDEGNGTTAADSSGNGNSGAINGATWTAGKGGGGLNFDGNDYVTRTNPSAGLKPSLEVATAAWIKMSATDTGGAEIVSMGDSYAIRVQTNGNVQFFYYNGTTWKSIITAGVNMRDGVWHHIVGQKTSTALQIYVDGISKASTPNTGTISYTLGTSLFTGRHGNGNTIYDFVGSIDDVRIYNRALSNQEVLELYNLYVQSPTPTPVTTPTPGLIPDVQARYALDEGNGATAADSSVNGNNGVINGATWATGKSGSGLSFDGNDYVIRTNPSAGLKPSLEVATAAWIKTSATDTGGAEIVSMGDSYAIRVQTNGNIQFFYYNGYHVEKHHRRQVSMCGTVCGIISLDRRPVLPCRYTWTGFLRQVSPIRAQLPIRKGQAYLSAGMGMVTRSTILLVPSMMCVSIIEP